MSNSATLKRLRQWLGRGLGWGLKDSLAKRLFLLIWVSLVISHVLAFATVRWLHDSPPPPPAGEPPPARHSHDAPLPTFPSLPPGPIADHPGPPPQGLSTAQSLLDYGVRLLVIALAAWLGSRWLAGPMQRLAQAATGLGDALKQQAPPPHLDEHSGTVEVREAARLFNQMAQQLRRQFQERGLLVAAISHDLRTPLTRLRMRLETLPLSEDARRPAVRDIQEMSQLIDTVLALFQSEREGEAAAEPSQTLDLTALLGALCDDLQEQGHSLSFKPGLPLLVRGQAGALRRALGNLLGNALRYGGSATVQTQALGASLRLLILDEGPGIPEAQLEAVFQPFYRLEGSRNRHTGGVGLGLYIARDLLQRQGASLRLLNRPEGGLCAEVEMACLAAATAPPAPTR
ncbi:signal transduction histidine kinase [Paucibacter oligotrophus]|uniref:histidine kinase n=1 Tax=Roseateles oligotrophus TaxID=1769250 RepID=A0A840KZU3_9BURK|nr:ATP-binding protein [Roseateles oligotrophus]MBB4841704.1 signal transduction histidine kinase [Roseateles oligotrophus]